MPKQSVEYELIQELIKIMPYSIATIKEECKEICGVEFDDLSIQELAQIDSKIFQCSCCGYWFNNHFCVIGEDEENWCKACYGERNDYDDM